MVISVYFLIQFCYITGRISDLQMSDYNTPFKCEKCGRAYRWPENLRRHIRQECGKEPKFVCNQCGYKAKYKSSVIMHLKRKHHINRNPVDFQCNGDFTEL